MTAWSSSRASSARPRSSSVERRCSTRSSSANVDGTSATAMPCLSELSVCACAASAQLVPCPSSCVRMTRSRSCPVQLRRRSPGRACWARAEGPARLPAPRLGVDPVLGEEPLGLRAERGRHAPEHVHDQPAGLVPGQQPLFYGRSLQVDGVQPLEAEQRRLPAEPPVRDLDVRLGRGEQRLDHPGVDLVLEVRLVHGVVVATQVVDGKPIGDERVVAVGDHGQNGFEERSRRLLRAPPHVAVGMGAPGRLELRERPLPLARAVVEAGRERAERAVAEGLPRCARARVAGGQRALLGRREHERAEPPDAEEVSDGPERLPRPRPAIGRGRREAPSTRARSGGSRRRGEARGCRPTPGCRERPGSRCRSW